MGRIAVLSACAVVFGVVGSRARSEAPSAGTGSISVTVREAGREAPLPCRAWVEAAGKRFFKPTTPSCKPYDRDRSFTCDGQFVIEVPAGKAIVHVERGREYVPADKAVVVEQKRTVELTIDLRRWIGMAKEGWYSADLHAHFDTKRGIVTMPACGCLA